MTTSAVAAQDTLYFPASKKKAVLLLLGSLAFVAIGAAIRAKQPLVGWLSIAFFGLGIPASLYTLLSKKVYLLLDPNGFEMGTLTKAVRIAWTDVDGFEIKSVNGARMIAILYNARYEKQRLLRGAVRALSGLEGGIANTYAAPLESVLQRLDEWHRRFGNVSA